MFINSPEKFAAWFNKKYPSAYRMITTEDVEDMTISTLIGRYRYYSESLDGETIRGILQYEQLREKRSAQEAADDKAEPPSCKLCGEPLPPHHVGRRGRPIQYCQGCQSSRATERYRRWRKR